MSVYLNVQKSLLKYCSDFILRHNLENFESFDFDAHATIDELPDADLLGIGEYTIENSTDKYMITCYIAVSTQADDGNLKRLRPVVDKLFDELRPGYRGIKCIDGNTGHLYGYLLVMDEVSAMPIARTTSRPLQMIAVQLASAFLTPP